MDIGKLTEVYSRALSVRVLVKDPRLVVLSFGNHVLPALKAETPSPRQIGIETNLGRPHIINVQDVVVKVPRNLVTYGQLRLPVLINGVTRARVVNIDEHKPLSYIITIAVERD